MSLLNARRVLRDVQYVRQRVALNDLIQQAHITWHGVELGRPDWRPTSHSIAFTAKLATEGLSFHVLVNAYWEPLDFDLPPISEGVRAPWRRWIDTFLQLPDDMVEWEHAPVVAGRTYRAAPRSVVVLFAVDGDAQAPANEELMSARRTQRGVGRA